MEKDINYYYLQDSYAKRHSDEFERLVSNGIFETNEEDIPYVISTYARAFMVYAFSNDASRDFLFLANNYAKHFNKRANFSHNDLRNFVKLKLGDKRIVKAERLTHKFPKLLSADKDFDSFSHRYASGVRCHMGSIQLSQFFEGDGEVVTGMIYDFSKDVPYSHSWLEITIDGKKYCIDYNANAILEKQDYYSLNLITEILSRHKWQTIIADAKDFSKFKDSKEYLIFRDKILASTAPTPLAPDEPSNE